jgi:CelD/BcsL family acetyltransferase involved in cellulose biosynthesis
VKHVEAARAVEVVAPGALRALAEEWNALYARMDAPNLFLTHAWVCHWAEHFGDDKLLVLARRDGGGRLAGAALFHLDGRRASTLPNDHTFLPAVLHGRGDEAPLGPFLAALRRRGVRSLRLEHVPASAAFAAELQRAEAGRWVHVTRFTSHEHAVDVSGTFEQYLATRDKKVRQELKRKKKKLEREKPGTTLQRKDAPADTDAVFAAIDAVEADCWKSAESGRIASRPVVLRHYREAFRRWAARGAARAYFLGPPESAAAFVLGIVEGGVFYALKTSYRGSLHQLSPGQVLFTSLIEALCRDPAVSRLELLGEHQRWKAELASESREVCDYFLYPRNLPNLAYSTAFTHLRPVARALLARALTEARRLRAHPLVKRFEARVRQRPSGD